MVAGTITTIKIGKKTVMVTTVPMKLAKQLIHCLIICGMVLSQTSTSFANLLTILPKIEYFGMNQLETAIFYGILSINLDKNFL